MGWQSHVLGQILSMDSKTSTEMTLFMYGIFSHCAGIFYIVPVFSVTTCVDWMGFSPNYFSDGILNTVTSCSNQANWYSECVNEWKNELDVKVVKYG